MVHNKKSLKKSLKVSFAGLRQHLNNVIKGPSSVFCFFFALQSRVLLGLSSHGHLSTKTKPPIIIFRVKRQSLGETQLSPHKALVFMWEDTLSQKFSG